MSSIEQTAQVTGFAQLPTVISVDIAMTHQGRPRRNFSLALWSEQMNTGKILRPPTSPVNNQLYASGKLSSPAVHGVQRPN
jgi:hypothetical protein